MSLQEEIETVDPRLLRVIVNYLYFVEDLDEFREFSAWDLERFEKSHEDEDKKRILAALRWAGDNPNYEFESLLPGIRFSREQVHCFLVLAHTQLERHFGDR